MRSALLAAVLVVSAVPSRAGGPAALSDDDRATFAWFDGLGFPPLRGKPYVRVRFDETESGGWEGLLLEETPTAWTVLGPSLWPSRVPRTARSGSQARRLETLDAPAALRRRLDAERSPPREASPQDKVFDLYERRVHLSTEALVLARWAAEAGAEDVAAGFLALARQRRRDPSKSLREIAEEDLAVSVLWRITVEFGVPEVPRRRLLSDLRAYVAAFPASPHLDTAKEAVRVLDRMVAEDAAHPRVDDARLATMPVAERVAELVFRLRDQNGGQFSQPGSPSVFFTWGERGEDKATPAHRLVEVGFDAVPALIDVLDDERFTRTVGFWRDFTYSHYVLRVGDAAREILERITKRSLWRSFRYTAASMHKDGQESEVKEAYRTWWAEFSGFLAPLRALAGAGSAGERARLAAALPDRAPGPMAGLPDTARWGTGGIVAALGLSRERGIEMLAAVLERSPHPRTRALAAWALLDLGDDRGVAAMAAAWKAMDAETRVDPRRGFAVASFLAACGRAEAVAALAEGLGEQSASVRHSVLLAFSDRDLAPVRGFAADEAGLDAGWNLPDDAARAAEDLIAGRLEDLERAPAPTGNAENQAGLGKLDPDYDAGNRIADDAVLVLASRWNEYAIPRQPVHSASEWESYRLRALERWKARRR
jgi:hypothetical protein